MAGGPTEMQPQLDTWAAGPAGGGAAAAAPGQGVGAGDGWGGRGRVRPLRRLTDVAGELVDERVGIVRHVQEVRRQHDDPEFFHFSAQACDTRAFGRNANFATTGGAATTRDGAAAKAIGEAVERYCAAMYDVRDLTLSPARRAPFACAAPADFALYGPGQYRAAGFPWVPFTPDTPVRWVAARDAQTGEACHVPAAMVYVPYYYYQGTGDAPIVQPISTGLACHCSAEEAAVAALCEVIERDHFTITWQGRLAPPQIRVETLDDEGYELVQRFERLGGLVTLFDLSLDVGVPTVLAVLRHAHPAAAALVFAAAADPRPARAVAKSLEELAHTRRYSQQVKTRMKRLAPDPQFENVVDQITHLNFWTDHANAAHADFLFASDRRVDFDDIDDASAGHGGGDLAAVASRVAATGHRALLADLTTPDVGGLGLSVVRAVVPGFHPLFMGHRLRALGGRRLWELPRRLGLVGGGDNPFPHPYP